jgi:hypothetical protein
VEVTIGSKWAGIGFATNSCVYDVNSSSLLTVGNFQQSRK